MLNRIPKARIYKKAGQFRFGLYGRVHYVKFVNERGIDKLNKIVSSDDNRVKIDLEPHAADHEGEIQAVIDGRIACHVEHIPANVKDIHLTEPTPMTFELLECVSEHDEFDFGKDAVLFSDKHLVIKWANSLYHYNVTLNENEVIINAFAVTEDNKIVSDNKIVKGSALAIMNLIESTDLDWNTIQEQIETTEEFALEYLEEFCLYTQKVFEDGTIF